MITVVRGRPSEAELAALVAAFVALSRARAADRARGVGIAPPCATGRAHWTRPGECYRAPHSWRS
ncbi:acyl-CoA carboxylase epsilon subunit [Streptomyces sp. CT34]|uniref:acyl-CoA carboxylase epsilon subunit n=1 Tax=Streptomyces sp. CT34 TaxID=1553907 RepID=UPI0005B909B8|nr:acyl-CoA carboxylase epsilon subunit [Streptomyces sp. CT34]